MAILAFARAEAPFDSASVLLLDGQILLRHRGQLGVRRHAEGVTAAELSRILPLPEVAQNTDLGEAEFGPLNPDVLVPLSEIEYAQVLRAGTRAVGYPDSLLAVGKKLAAVGALLIHGQHLVVRNEGGGVFVVARQIAAEDEGGLGDAPQAHHRALFHRGEP